MDELPSPKTTCLIEQQLDKQLCDAFNCNELATETIGVSAGEFGIIELNICKNCVSKFNEVGLK